MSKITIFTATAVLIAFGLTAAPVSADLKEQCAADIKIVEDEFAFASSGWGYYASVQSFIVIAKEAHKAGKNKKCIKMMEKAKKYLDYLG